MTTLYRRLTLTGAGLVTLATLVASSVHLYAVSSAAGAGWLSFLTPVAVDGLGLTAAVSLWAARQRSEEASTSAIAAFVLAISASIGGNVLWPFLPELSEKALQVLAAVVAVYPAVALAISVELVLAAVRQQEDTVSAEEETVPSEQVTVSETQTVETLELSEVAREDVPAEPEQMSLLPLPDDPLSRLRHLLTEKPDATSSELAQLVGRSASWVRGKRAVIRKELTAA